MGERGAARGVDRRVIVLAVAIPLVLLAGFVLVEVLDGGDGDVDEALTTTVAPDPPASTVPVAVDEAWNEALVEALEPLGDAIPRLSDAVTSWAAGELGDAALAEVLDAVEPTFAAVRQATADLPQHPADEHAAPLVRGMGRLYALAVDAHRLAVAEQGGVATQYDRLGRRLRVLADRMFDRARERTAVPFDPGEGVDLRLPAEVPDWTRLGLAVGPPLEPADTNVDELPLERDDERASQPTAEWESVVEALDAPAPDAIRDALESGDAEALGEQARSLVAAVEALRTVAVPEGDRGRADRLGLAWLLRADAARAGQLATATDRDATALALAVGILDVATTPALTSG